MEKQAIKEINASVDLIEYASQQMNLIKRGKDYFCSCPLHEDKTPSLSFNSEANLFYCFSCGRGGGIVNYLRYYEGLSFDDAVKKAKRLSGKDWGAISKTQAFLRSMEECSSENITHDILDKSIYNKYSKEPIELWIEEGISQEVMELFEIRIDRSQNRIVYPVYDMQGNFINIKGRTMYPNFKELGLAKYINYYPVGTVDYFQGYNVTKNHITNEVIIFEGIKSVMKAYQWGHRNCMSAEKHSLTDSQIDILASLHADIVFAYDKDVDYSSNDTRKDLYKLSRICNVYVARDIEGQLSEKDAPVDKGKEIWENIYNKKQRVTR